MDNKKTPEVQQMERKAQELERQIVRFTNIDNESFTHSYRGISITVKKGESYIGRMPECNHLATHLARKILSTQKKKEKGHTRAYSLFPEKEVYELKKKILSDVAIEAPSVSTPEETRKQDQEILQKKYDKKPEDITKKDVIKELESRGIKVDASKTKEELLQELMDLEIQGK